MKLWNFELPNITLLLLLVSNFTFHRKKNCESYNDLLDKTTETTETEVEMKKKRIWPRQKGESDNKEWEDDKIFALIDAWSGIEQYFNCKHQKYHPPDEKMKLLEKINSILHENGINITVTQITDKIHSLRNYYSAERRKEYRLPVKNQVLGEIICIHLNDSFFNLCHF